VANLPKRATHGEKVAAAGISREGLKSARSADFPWSQICDHGTLMVESAVRGRLRLWGFPWYKILYHGTLRYGSTAVCRPLLWISRFPKFGKTGDPQREGGCGGHMERGAEVCPECGVPVGANLHRRDPDGGVRSKTQAANIVGVLRCARRADFPFRRIRQNGDDRGGARYRPLLSLEYLMATSTRRNSLPVLLT
jgi:hypothetical protein